MGTSGTIVNDGFLDDGSGYYPNTYGDKCVWTITVEGGHVSGAKYFNAHTSFHCMFSKQYI